jgi:regulator of sirC expression with transglutaminase-like and TPR domain
MDLDQALAHLARQPDSSHDVAEMALLLARDEYPALDVEGYLSEIAAMAHEARHYVRGSLEARVHGLCRYLFHELGFHGNIHDYFDPRNSYLNDVLDRRMGIPITLAVVAMAIGQRVGLNIVGIGLPGHFVVKACGCSGEVLFDPFHGGRRLTPELC